ncbi:hypothetical protein PVL29_012249 [Vitis rotundifolia]|uniref:OTU domain-containing protein n=1 Tax=Vitis rotundifolia TaxID=103349 RepID=A0AA39DTB9_VITRO|nr:hypothetical protein PVL29_012249 [Vitis rotundifolia]
MMRDGAAISLFKDLGGVELLANKLHTEEHRIMDFVEGAWDCHMEVKTNMLRWAEIVSELVPDTPKSFAECLIESYEDYRRNSLILKEEIEDSMDVHVVVEGQFIDEKNNIELSNKLMAGGFQKEEKNLTPVINCSQFKRHHRLVKMPGDGNCFFHAIIYAFDLKEVDHVELRASLVKAFISKRKHIREHMKRG